MLHDNKHTDGLGASQRATDETGSRKRRYYSQNRSLKKNNLHNHVWRTSSWIIDAYHKIYSAATRSYYQETSVDILGDRSQDIARWKAAARNDPRLRRLQEGLAASQ